MSSATAVPWRDLPRRIRIYIASCFVIMFATPVIGVAFLIYRSAIGQPL